MPREECSVIVRAHLCLLPIALNERQNSLAHPYPCEGALEKSTRRVPSARVGCMAAHRKRGVWLCCESWVSGFAAGCLALLPDRKLGAWLRRASSDGLAIAMNGMDAGRGNCPSPTAGGSAEATPWVGGS